MEHGLSGIFIAVHHRTIAVIGNTCLRGYFLCGQVQTADDLLIVRLDVVDRRNVLSRNHKYVCRRLRANVAKSDGGLLLVNQVGRNLAGQNLAEQAITRHLHSLNQRHAGRKTHAITFRHRRIQVHHPTVRRVQFGWP